MIYLLNCGRIKVTFDIIILHVGTNDVNRLEIADFDIAYNILISTVKKLVRPGSVIVLSAILPRPIDFQETGYFVATVNSRLKSTCLKLVLNL